MAEDLTIFHIIEVSLKNAEQLNYVQTLSLFRGASKNHFTVNHEDGGGLICYFVVI